MSYDWTTNWINHLHKGGDVNNVNNYQTIMVGKTIWIYNRIKDKYMG